MRRSFLTGVMACVFAVGLSSPMLAQTAKDDAKQAGRDTAAAGKDAGNATAKGAKRAAKKTKRGAKKAAKATKDALTPDTTRALCKDGTTQTGKTKTTACD